MNKEQHLFLNLISSALTGKKCDVDIINSDFETLESLASVNSCLSLIYQGCVNSEIQPPIHWKHNTSFVVIDSHRKLTVENELINILQKNRIRSCILKGSSVSMNYPNPLGRTMGDIDILVDEYNYEKASLLFVSKEKFENNKHDFHVSFQYKNVDVEIHKQVTRYNDGSVYQTLFDDCMKQIKFKKCDEFDIPVLSEKHQAISLLTHMIRHFSENKFVFRMFCDWVCFADSISEKSWHKDVYPFIEEAGLSLYADALNKSSMIYLGFDMQAKLVHEIDYETCEILMEEFASKHKSSTTDGMDVNLGTVFSYSGFGEKNFLCTYISSVNYIARTKYSLGKYKIFWPLFWVWLPAKYVFNILIGKRKRLDLKKISDTAVRRKKLIDNLELPV